MNINNLERIRSNIKQLTIEKIKEFEKWRGYELPKDFVEFTLNFPFAHIDGEFNAEGRPNSMISNMLNFSKEGYSSIYIDEAYDINDFGPYVLFGEDPRGNYIAFDYSKNPKNPPIVFIDHEELGIINKKLVYKSLDDENGNLEISNKLIDFPWAIYYIAESFTDFMNIIKYEDNNKIIISPSKFKFAQDKFDEINAIFDFGILECIENFIKSYGGWDLNDIKFNYASVSILLDSVLNFNDADFLDYKNILSFKGGINKYKKYFPFLIVHLNNDDDDISSLSLKFDNGNVSLVIIPHNVFDDKNNLDDNKVVFVANDVCMVISEIERVIVSKIV